MASCTSSNDLLPPYEIVFSCAICQKTITDLYPQAGSDKALNDGSNDAERPATKLWMTECAHISCGEHLEGGGAPFHPASERPRAACPVCVTERGDLTKKKLFGIVSNQPGEHDTAIPTEFFETPPDDALKDSSHVARALRFQYLSMLRYGRMMRTRYEEANRSIAAAAKPTNELLASVQKLKEECSTLQSTVKSLEATEKKYKTFKDREPEIKHYLGQFAGIARENAFLKEQLLRLGYDVPRTIWSMAKPPPKAGAISPSQCNRHPFDQKQSVGVVNAAGDVQFAGSREPTIVQHLSSSSGRKRTHNDYLEGKADGDLEVLLDDPLQQQDEVGDSMLPQSLSRQHPDRMPPPAQMGQTKKTTLQQNLEPSSNKDVHQQADISKVQLCHHGTWTDARSEDVQMLQYPRRDYPTEAPLMADEFESTPNRRRAEARQTDHQNVDAIPQPRFTRPAPHSRMGDECQFRQPLLPPRPNLLEYQRTANEANQYLRTPAPRHLSSRAASRSSFVRQSLIPTASRGNIHRPSLGYLINSDPYQASPYPQMDESFASARPRQVDIIPSMTFESPFFKAQFKDTAPLQESPRYHRGVTGQSEILVSGLQDLRMKPVPKYPKTRHSLNALSFTDEPYMAANQSIYAQQQSYSPQSQDSQPFRPTVISRTGFIQDPRVQQQIHRQPNSIRLPSTMPSSSQPLSHATKGVKNGGSVVRPLGEHARQSSTNIHLPVGDFLPRNNGRAASSRGIFTATGRRSVRR